MRRTNLVRVAAAFVGGIGLACVARGACPPARGWGLLSAVGLVAGLYGGAAVWRRRTVAAPAELPSSWYGRPGPPGGAYWRSGLSRRAWVGAAVLVAAAGLGFGRAWGELGPPPPSLAAFAAGFRPWPGGRVWLTGTVMEDPAPTKWGQRLFLRPDGTPGRAGLVCLTLTPADRGGDSAADASLRAGMRLGVPARLTRPVAANPGEEPFTGVTPKGRLLAYAWAARSAVTVETAPGRTPGGWLGGAVDRWETGVRRTREAAGRLLTCRIGGETAAIARALVLGERGLLGEETQEQFARAGAIHLLVVSGLHLSVVAALATALAQAAGAGERGRAAAAMVAAASYGSLTGWTAPVTRAALMTILAQAARLFGRQADSEHGLWFAVCLMLLQRPLLFCEAGFQLSVAATWGVVALAPALEERVSRCRFWPRGALGRGLAVTLGAQAATIPLSLQYFGRMPFLAVLVSPLLVGLADALVEAGVLVLAVGAALPVLAPPLSAGFGGGAFLFWQATRSVGQLPCASLNLPALPEGLSVLYYAFLWRAARGCASAAPPALGSPRSPRWAWLLACSAAAILGAALWSGRSPMLEATFLSVGQADALHLRLPGGLLGPNLLIDAGSSASRPVGYLRRRAVQALSAVVITHPHHDHRGGLTGIQAAFPIRRLIDGEDGGWQAEALSGVQLKVTGGARDALTNEASRRIMVRYGRFCLVTTGDAPLTAGDPLLTGLPRRGTRAGDALVIVIKVPHHGARGSVDPEFLRRYRPDLAVIQVGPNDYGHPNPALVALLQGAGTKVARTDREGAVRVQTDGRWVGVRVYPPE